MTTSTQAFSGTSPSFPPPMGAEQMFGYPQQTHGYGPQSGMPPQPFQQFQQFQGQPQYQGQPQPYQVQQVAHQLATQVVQLAQQMILPQIAGLAVQLVSQLAMSNQTGQQGGGQFGPPQWGQPQQAQLPFGAIGRPYPSQG